MKFRNLMAVVVEFQNLAVKISIFERGYAARQVGLVKWESVFRENLSEEVILTGRWRTP